MGTYVIQRTVDVADVADLGADTRAVRGAAVAMSAAGQPVRVLHCTYIPVDRTCLYVVEADDPATVMETLRRAGTTTARVLPALAL